MPDYGPMPQQYPHYTPQQPGYQNPMYNPYYNNPYLRLQQLEQAYPQYGQTTQPIQQPQQPQNVQPIVKSVPVTSIDEAKTANVLDGSRYLFYNTSNGQIYSRQFDVQTGKAETIVYERTTPPETPAEQPRPTSEIQALTDRVNALEAKINEYGRSSANDDTAKPAGESDTPATPANAKARSKPGAAD